MTFRPWCGPLLLSTALLLSCSTPIRRTDVPLTTETFRSSDGALQGLIPQGWFASTDPELVPHLLAWIVRDDHGATLSFQEIRVDPTTASRIEKTGLTLLAEISFRLKRAAQPSTQLTMPPQAIVPEKNGLCRYEYSQEGGVETGVLVFRIGNRFFESSVLSTRSSLPREEYRQLLDVQEAVVTSLRP